MQVSNWCRSSLLVLCPLSSCLLPVLADLALNVHQYYTRRLRVTFFLPDCSRPLRSRNRTAIQLRTVAHSGSRTPLWHTRQAPGLELNALLIIFPEGLKFYRSRSQRTRRQRGKAGQPDGDAGQGMSRENDFEEEKRVRGNEDV